MVRRRSFLIGSALTAGSLITGWYLGSILPYRKTDEVLREVTKTITDTETKYRTETKTETVTSTKTVTSTTTVTQTPRVDVKLIKQYSPALAAYLLDLEITASRGVTDVTSVVKYPNHSSEALDLERTVGGYRGLIDARYVGGYSISVEPLSDGKKGYGEINTNVAISQGEREGFSNQELLDELWKESLAYNPSLAFDREEFYRPGFEILKEGRITHLTKPSQETLVHTLGYYGADKQRMLSEIDLTAMVNGLQVLNGYGGVTDGFDNDGKFVNLLKLTQYVPNILRYPKEWREGAIQIYDIANLVNPPNEKEKWAVLGPMIAYGIDKLDRGEAMDLTLPDKKIEAWARRERLLPLDLFKINIVSGEYSDQPRFEIGRYNVSTNDNLGISPQVWLDDMAKKDFREKNLRYELAILRARESHPNTFWPNSDKEYLRIFDTVLREDEEAVFIQGYPDALRGEYIPFKLEPIVPMSGQMEPFYSKFIARAFGRASFVVGLDYPDELSYPKRRAHAEAYVVISPEIYGKMSSLVPYTFGYWTSGELLKKDHDGKKSPNPRIFRPDWTKEQIII